MTPVPLILPMLAVISGNLNLFVVNSKLFITVLSLLAVAIQCLLQVTNRFAQLSKCFNLRIDSLWLIACGLVVFLHEICEPDL